MAKILIVDDEIQVRTIAVRILEKAGHVCAAAESVQEARLSLETDHFDLVLLDIQMPEESGLVLLEELQGAAPDTAVVIVSVIDDHDIAKMTIDLGAYGYIPKPFGKNDLQIHVTNALRRRELEISNMVHQTSLEALLAERSRDLAATEENLRLLMKSAVGFAVYQLAFDPDNPLLARVVFVSPSIKELLGIEDPYRLEAWLERIHPEDLETIIDGNRRSWTEGGTLFLKGRVFHQVKKEWRWIQLIASGAIDLSGAQTRANGILVDITDRIHAEEQIKFQAQLLNGVREAIIAADLDGFVTYWGQGAEKLFGFTADEVLGKHVDEIFNLEDEKQYHTLLNYILDNGHWSGQLKSKRKNGDGFWSDTAISLIRDSERKPTGMIAIDRDITRQKEFEKSLKDSREELRRLSQHLQTALEKERTIIAREIHDDLGQILTALKMDITMLARKLPEEQTDLKAKTGSVIELVNDGIRSVRRISSGLRPSLLDDLGLAAAIEWQVKQFREHTGIACELKMEPGEIALNEETATAAFRILQESLTNVAKHAGAKQVMVELKTENNNLILVVRDDGCGIPDRLKQLPGTFGLIGMRERAHVLGGDLRITPNPGQGSTVAMLIPLGQKGLSG